MKSRIWELDALRGLLIIGMVIVHILYDLSSLLGLFDLSDNALFQFVKGQGGILFFLLSGLCATLGSRNIRRGLTVFLCGLLISLVTWGMYLLGFADKNLIIYFGVLHCLGLCMILWSIFRRLPSWAISLSGSVIILLGFYLQTRYFETGVYLLPFGLRPAGFATSDYFPLLPYLGFFLWGAVLGKRLYREKQSLFPNVRNPLVSFLTFCGRWSLLIYLLHQPVLMGLAALFSNFL